MGWTFFSGVFGGWSWEQLDAAGEVTAESQGNFESREEAEADAMQHGYCGEEAAPETPGPDRDTPPIERVMVVQRDLSHCREVARLLTGLGIVVTTSYDHALALARASVFDCYIVDCSMNDDSLARFCAQVQAIDARVPIVLYTDDSNVHGGSQALTAGANIMLKRPDDAEVLAHTVSAMLELSRRRGLEARSAAQRAIEEALAARIGATRPGAAPGQRSDSSVARRRLLEEYETRRLASTAFLHAGGTRGEFERAWPQLISDVTQGRGR